MGKIIQCLQYKQKKLTCKQTKYANSLCFSQSVTNLLQKSDYHGRTYPFLV